MIQYSVVGFRQVIGDTDNNLSDIIQYFIVGFLFNGDYSILCNRDNDVSIFGNTNFPPQADE